jgi:molybdopterin synthase catalytic subunit
MALDTMALDTMALDTMARDTMALDTMARDTMARGTMVPNTTVQGTTVLHTTVLDTTVLGTMVQGTMVLDTMARGTTVQGTMVQGTMVPNTGGLPSGAHVLPGVGRWVPGDHGQAVVVRVEWVRRWWGKSSGWWSNCEKNCINCGGNLKRFVASGVDVVCHIWRPGPGSGKLLTDWIDVFTGPLDVAGAHQYLADESSRDDSATSDGATVLFLGRVRQYTDAQNTGFSPTSPVEIHRGRPVVRTPALHYECYPDMARRAMQRLAAETRQNWPVGRLILHHRVGHLPVGEIAILIGVTSSHRAAAYAANQFLIDQVKQRVPVWKQEIFASGARAWVHPLPDRVQ